MLSLMQPFSYEEMNIRNSATEVFGKSQIRSDQIRSDQIRSDQIRSEIMSNHDVTSYYIMLIQNRSHHIILCFLIPHHITSDHTISYHIILYHIISCHIISYDITSYHTISYHIISYHTMSYHIIDRQINWITDYGTEGQMSWGSSSKFLGGRVHDTYDSQYRQQSSIVYRLFNNYSLVSSYLFPYRSIYLSIYIYIYLIFY